MKYVSGGRVYRIPASVKRDLNTIKKSVEKELKISMRGPWERRSEYVNAKRVFIALVLYVYNILQRKLESPNIVTLAALAGFLEYKSHSSISLHLMDSHKGYRSILDFIEQDDELRACYSKLKIEININHKLPFRKLVENKRAELEQEIAIINRYLKIHTPDEESKD